ncbi:MAG: hypothetical protein GX620_18705 [Chloroflexi bacterium]|nr:hypothetical protein [Chloroflexota bacterium]
MRSVIDILHAMTTEEKVGQIIHAPALEDDAQWPSNDERRLIEHYHIGGVRIYSRLPDPAFCREYTNALQRWALDTRLGLPLLVGIDGETGVDVVRTGTSIYPSATGIALQSLDVAQEVSAQIGRESLAVGISLNQRPVADVNTNPDNPVIGLRSPGDNANVVASQVEASILGARNVGLITCAKHFPGHGDTAFDSHAELNAIACSLEEMEDVHLRPFARAIQAGVDTVMTAHVLVPCLDPEYPATLSNRILTHLLRNQMGFRGVIITDSMGMAAIADHFSVPDATVQAVQAGVDLVLTCRDFDATVLAYEGLLRAVQAGVLPMARLDDAVMRVLRLKESRDWFSRERLGTVENAVRVCHDPAARRLNRDVIRRSMAVVRNSDALPIRRGMTTLVTGPVSTTALARSLLMQGRPSLALEWLSASQADGWSPLPEEAARVQDLAGHSDTVIVLTFAQCGRLPEGQRALIEGLRSTGSRIVVVDLGFPRRPDSSWNTDGHIVTFAQARRPTELSQPYIEVLTEVLVDEHPTVKPSTFRVSTV